MSLRLSPLGSPEEPDRSGRPDSRNESAGLSRNEWLATTGIGVAIAVFVAVAVYLTNRHGERELGTISPGPSRRLIPFQLTDQTGRTVSNADLSGKLLVVDFVFTSCSLSCRAVNDRMEEIQRLVSDDPDIRLISLTVDPRTDTPPVLAKFAAEYHAESNRWLFLTGEKSELYPLIESSFISRSPNLESLVPGGLSDTARIMLVDAQGQVRASFNGLAPHVAQNVVASLQRIRRSTPPQ